MNILQKGIMTDGTKLQIEDWSADYSFYPQGHLLAAYPIAKASLQGQFTPKMDRKFRYEMRFDSNEQAQKAFNDLCNGVTTLKDYSDKLQSNDKEYAKCV